MIGFGTLLNTAAIIFAGVIGVVFKSFLKERYQDSILKASGMAVLMLGLAGSLSKMLSSGGEGQPLVVSGTMIMVLSLVLGAIVGEIIDIDGKFGACQVVCVWGCFIGICRSGRGRLQPFG